MLSLFALVIFRNGLQMRIMIAVLLPVIMSSALSPLYFRLSHEAQIILLDFFIEKTIVLFTYNENLEKEAFYYAENRFYVVPPTKVHEIAFFDHTGKPVDDVFITQSVVKFWENETFHFGTDWQMLHRYDWIGCGMDLNETDLGFFICFFA